MNSPSPGERMVHPSRNVAIERQCLVLSQDEDAAQSGINAVAEGNINDAIAAPKRDGWFGPIPGQRVQALAGAPASRRVNT